MTRLIRIVIFTCLITAIVFLGFRASQPLSNTLTGNHPASTNDDTFNKTENTNQSTQYDDTRPNNTQDENDEN